MSEPLIFNSIKEFINYRQNLNSQLKVGFVPTMGALHQGHASLMQRAHQQNDISVLSIYVNPTQFNNPDDLKKYPQTWETDIQMAQESGINVVLAPRFDEIYADNYRYQVIEKDFSKKLCGAFREGHFDGVLTVVMKLLQITKPTHAYFGEKDYQQLQLIKDMVAAFFIPTEIVAVPTVREHDGLAMSSRNTRLSLEARQKAPALYKALLEAKNFAQAQQLLQPLQIELEYFEEHFNRRFIAAYLEGVRLIDNVKI